MDGPQEAEETEAAGRQQEVEGTASSEGDGMETGGEGEKVEEKGACMQDLYSVPCLSFNFRQIAIRIHVTNDNFHLFQYFHKMICYISILCALSLNGAF